MMKGLICLLLVAEMMFTECSVLAPQSSNRNIKTEEQMSLEAEEVRGS
jgi:hypothetical protein